MIRKSIFSILKKHFGAGREKNIKDIPDDKEIKEYHKKEKLKHNLRLLLVFLISVLILAIIYLIVE